MTDPLNVSLDINDTNTEIPILPAGDYPLQIVESVIETNKDQNGNNWRIKFATTQAYTDIENHPVAVNFPITVWHPLQAKDDAKDPESYKRNVASAVDAIFECERGKRPQVNKALLESATGKTVIATIQIEIPDKGPYAGKKTNRVARLKKVG